MRTTELIRAYYWVCQAFTTLPQIHQKTAPLMVGSTMDTTKKTGREPLSDISVLQWWHW